MTFGTSHDTAEFACNCIAEHWESTLRHIYPNAKEILLLCDGGGSNSARGWLFKWELIQLAKKIKVNIRVAHYPPYCSKWNPIEHRLFSQITRVWKGAIFNSVELARDLAAGCRTKTGLAVFTSINRNVYETKNALAIMKMNAESTSSMMRFCPNGTMLSNGRVSGKSYQVIF